MTIEERIKKSETRFLKVVFPDTTNHYDTLFGGKALQMMDEAAFVSATRFGRKRMVTVSVGQIDFKRAIPLNTIVEIVAEVSTVGNTSLQVTVNVYGEDMYSEDRYKAITGTFTFVAIDEDRNPISIL